MGDAANRGQDEYDADLEAMLDNIRREVRGARAKFPKNEHMHAALAEEVGEVAKAFIEHHRGKDTPQHAYTECVQAAAMAVRMGLEGSREFAFYGYHRAWSDQFKATSE